MIPDSVSAMVTPLIKTNLTIVDLSHNAFGPQGIKGFEHLLKQNKHIKIFRITNCGLSPEGGEMIAAALKEGGLKLTELAIGRNRQEDKGFTALGEVLGNMGTLQVFDGPQNGVRADGMVAMFNGLMKNQNLQDVRVNDNFIKDDAVNRLCKLIYKLGRKKSLKVLDISDCDLEQGSLGKIVNYLHGGKAKSSLEVLKVNFCAGDPANK